MPSPEMFVMDCSVTMALLFVEEQQSVNKIEALFKKNEAIVPNIWQYEVANLLCVAERTKRIQEADIAEIKSILTSLPIRVDDISSTKTFGNTLTLAREYQLTVYDAAYLELTMRKGVALVTFDKALKVAAKKAGASIILL